MNKKLKIIISITILVVIIAGLLFFVFFKDEKSRFIGAWEYASSGNEVEIFSWNISFFENNTAKIEYIPDQYHDESITWGKYTLNNNEICFEINNEIPEGFDNFFPNLDIEDFSKECYTYDFSNEDNILTLTSEGYTFVFTKQ